MRRQGATVFIVGSSEAMATARRAFAPHAACTYAAPLPRYVVKAFEDYLGCGDLAGGLLRCHCDGCGHDVLVAFSCKGRGLCPSCGARRMCNEAAMLVDRVLPNAPLRQWVLSLPFELRGVAATKPDVLGAMERIFAEEIERLTKRLAGIAGAATGSIGFPQRFGSSLNLHVPLHTLAIDGVFDKTDDGGVCVHQTPPPSKDDVDEVARRVRDRALRWLRRPSYLDERAAEERGNEPREPDALQGCMQLALAGGAFLARPAAPKRNPDADMERRERRFSASCSSGPCS
jgi:Putative transposase.